MWPYPKGLKLKLISRAKYNKRTGCLEWFSYKEKRGYGLFTVWFFHRVNVRPHKVLLELKLGRPLKYNMESLHECDNPACISTAKGHVREGTHFENVGGR